jgi:hypothetical protein
VQRITEGIPIDQYIHKTLNRSWHADICDTCFQRSDLRLDAAQLSDNGSRLLVGDEWRNRRPLEVTAFQQLWDTRPA